MSGSLAATSGLSPNDVVSVSVSLQQTAVALRNFGAFLVIGPTQKAVSTNERMRVYTTLSGVTADFATTTPEYYAANLFFSQSPQPSILYIGKWAQTGTYAVLQGGTPLAANQVVSGWTGITTGSMQITVDGVVKTLSNLNFGAQVNMNGVAGVIQTALGGAITCVWNASYTRFEIYSGTTGATSTLTYASPTGSGVDISALTGLTAASGANAPCAGIAAETPAACMAIMLNYGSWYGSMFATTTYGDITNAQYLAVAALIQAASPSRVFGVTTQEGAALSALQSTDIGSQMQALSYGRTFVQYSSSSQYAVASAYGRGLTVNFQGNNTTITLKFQTEPGVAAETLNESQWASLKAKNTNVFVNYAFTTPVAIIQEGVMSDGTFFDTRVGADWLQNQIQTDVFNAMYTAGTKIPQTDPGMNILGTVVANSCSIGIKNGLLAPGVWNAPGFGAISYGQFLPAGFYVYVQPMASQTQAVRATRAATAIQVAAKLGGAIHSSQVLVNINS